MNVKKMNKYIQLKVTDIIRPDDEYCNPCSKKYHPFSSNGIISRVIIGGTYKNVYRDDAEYMLNKFRPRRKIGKLRLG